MSERGFLIGAIAVAVLVLGFMWYKNQKSEPQHQPWVPNQQQQQSSQLEGVFKQARETNKSVVLFFTSPGCVPCEQMKKDVLPKPEVQKALGNYLFTQVDASADPAMAQMFQIKAVPTFVMVNGGMQVQKVQEGVMTADQFIVWLGGTVTPPKTEPQKQPEKKPEQRKPWLRRPGQSNPPGC